LRKKLIIISMLLVLAIAAMITGCDQRAGEEADTLTIGVTPWTSTIPPTEIATLILEEMGYEVNRLETDVSAVFMGLAQGDNDIFMDVWLPAHNVQLANHGAAVEIVSLSYDEAEQGLVVPTYMEDYNSIDDLIGNEEVFGNEIISIEAGAVTAEVIDKMIADYPMDMNQINSSEAGMMAEVERRTDREAPIVFYGWRPHTMFRNYDLKILEDPGNYFEDSTVHVAVTADLHERAPEAYNFLSNWSISVDDVEQMIVEIEDEGRPGAEVAREWIEENREHVDQMIGQ